MFNLVDSAGYRGVEDAGDEQILDVAGLDVQLPRDEPDLDPSVRAYQLDQHLSREHFNQDDTR